MKLAIIYDSKTGNTKQAGDWIVEGMNQVDGVEARAFLIGEEDQAFVEEAKGIVIGSPSYSASMSPSLRTWLFESGSELGMAGKLGGSFATVQYTHGGGDLVIQSIIMIELSFGMLCYSSGVEFGKPYIHLGPVAVNHNEEAHNRLENYKDNFVVYGERFASKAMEIFG